ncbi:hypothetical protein VTK56DRAFT_1451 [Thermocarpiscus australiensis]
MFDLEFLHAPPFTQKVVQAMRSLYPEELADRTWDNVGLLLENVHKPSFGDGTPTVLLTNDLTLRVAEEAIKKQVSVIVSYHPFIFRGLKSISINDPHQRIVLALAHHNIAVYSPHTAVDAAPGGINDWLADMLDHLGVATKRSVAKPIAGPVPEGFSGAGYGRLVELGDYVSLGRVVEAYAAGLGGLRHVMVARPKRDGGWVSMVQSVAICAGSGYDVLKDTTADLIVTGEMSHHNALRLTMLGKCVITVFHSNSERGFLPTVLQPQLKAALEKLSEPASVLVSEEDRDPFEVWDVTDVPESAHSGLPAQTPKPRS